MCHEGEKVWNGPAHNCSYCIESHSVGWCLVFKLRSKNVHIFLFLKIYLTIYSKLMGLFEESGSCSESLHLCLVYTLLVSHRKYPKAKMYSSHAFLFFCLYFMVCVGRHPDPFLHLSADLREPPLRGHGFPLGVGCQGSISVHYFTSNLYWRDSSYSSNSTTSRSLRSGIIN